MRLDLPCTSCQPSSWAGRVPGRRGSTQSAGTRISTVRGLAGGAWNGTGAETGGKHSGWESRGLGLWHLDRAGPGRTSLWPVERWMSLAPASPGRRLATKRSQSPAQVSAVPNTRGTRLPPSGQIWRDQRPKNQPGWQGSQRPPPQRL